MDSLPFWVSTAYNELGNTDSTRYGASKGEFWCSVFLNWLFSQSCTKGTASALARSWLVWGLKIDTPKPGAITVFSCPERGPDAGHVGLWLDAHDGWTYILGGNQSGRVGVSRYLTATILGYRWPEGLFDAKTA
jgi:uncharacterized protein (TIGR02594 family)